MARLLALFMGVWLSLVQSDAGLFHACSTGNAAIAAHEAGAVASMDAPQAGDEHAGHDAHASHEAGTAAESAPAQHHHSSGDNECHCIGHCCVTTVPALRSPDTSALATVVRIATVQPGRVSHDVVAEWADYVLPFATAPPAVIAG
jgi:hypothetical protein